MSSDLSLIDPELAARSLSRLDIALRLDDVITAAEQLTRAGRRLEAWEGWVQLPGGGRARSLEHQGAFVLPPDPAAALSTAIAQMREAEAKWERRPEYEGATLYFCLLTGARG